MPVRRSFRGVSFSRPMAPSVSSCPSARFSLSLGISFRPASCSISIFWLPHRFSVSVGFFGGFFFFFFVFIRRVRMNFRRKRLSRAFFHSRLSIVKLGIRIGKLGIFALWHFPTSTPSNYWSFESLHLKISFSIFESLDITIFQAFHVYTLLFLQHFIFRLINLWIFESFDLRIPRYLNL